MMAFTRKKADVPWRCHFQGGLTHTKKNAQTGSDNLRGLEALIGQNIEQLRMETTEAIFQIINKGRSSLQKM